MGRNSFNIKQFFKDVEKHKLCIHELKNLYLFLLWFSPPKAFDLLNIFSHMELLIDSTSRAKPKWSFIIHAAICFCIFFQDFPPNKWQLGALNLPKWEKSNHFTGKAMEIATYLCYKNTAREGCEWMYSSPWIQAEDSVLRPPYIYMFIAKRPWNEMLKEFHHAPWSMLTGH